MTDTRSLQMALNAPDQTATLAAAVSQVVTAGDCVLLFGDIGMGKSLFARCVIQTILARYGLAEDVPSPTFTLVQTYETPNLSIWHADLYRLGSVDELHEIGLLDALGDSLTLIEWPDRCPGVWPSNRLELHLSPGPHDEARIARLSGPALTLNQIEARL